MSSGGQIKDPRRQDFALHQAVEEAHRCLLCHDAPCSQKCPGGTDPAKFIRQIRFSNLKGAARTVLRNNPLGACCGFVCPTERTCAGACVRAGLDRPIDIARLQRFVSDYGYRLGLQLPRAPQSRPERVAVVGAGPAGLTAASCLASLGYQVVLFESRPEAGGMLRYGAPEQRLPQSILERELRSIQAQGVELRCNQAVETLAGNERALLTEGFAAVFVAPGLWEGRELSLPGSDLEGVTTALRFLVSARSEPERARALVADRQVVIIGGGAVALDAATTACRLGARRAWAVALEGFNELPASPLEVEEALDLGVLFRCQSQVSRIIGEGGRVVAVEGVEVEWAEPGSLSPDNARPLSGASFRLPAGVVIQAVGQRVTSEAAILIRQAQEDHGKPFFLGGDVVRQGGQGGTVIEAVADGKQAAQLIHERLSMTREVA